MTMETPDDAFKKILAFKEKFKQFLENFYEFPEMLSHDSYKRAAMLGRELHIMEIDLAVAIVFLRGFKAGRTKKEQ